MRNVYQFRPGAFTIYGSMADLWMSSDASVKVAGGTYDAGKTYGLCAYIDKLANDWPGARMTFVHRSLNRVYRNIIPTYEKYLGYKPPSRDDNPEGRDVTRFGGERPEFLSTTMALGFT